MKFGPRGPLRGTASVPGDKSISHRALMLAAMARGRSRIEGVADGSDVLSTAAALEAMGVRIGRDGTAWTVDGVGTGCLLQPRQALDMGNSGTSTRLLAGLVASHPITATFTGDPSLSRRPMDRVIRPLARLGAEFASTGERLPLTVRGIAPALPRIHRLGVASAQVKSSLLLAGLNTPGLTTVIEPVATRDHSERMLKLFGANIEVRDEKGERHIMLGGEAELAPQNVQVPGDPSAAAFLAVAALIVPGSELRIGGIGINPMRRGLFDVLGRMGANLGFSNERELSGEPAADLQVRSGALRGIDVPPEAVPAMIDEFPIFFVAAAFASGTSRARGLGELRIKESDRIAAMAAALRAIGAEVEEEDDSLAIHGSGCAPLPGGVTIASLLDHRIAMSLAVAGLRCSEPVTVDDMSPVATSFPGFIAALDALT